MNKYELNDNAVIEFAELEREVFSSKIGEEILRINAIQVPPMVNKLWFKDSKGCLRCLGVSSQHERNMDTMDRELDNYLAANFE